MQEQLVAQARTSLAEAQKRADTVRTRLSHAERVYGETSSVGTLTRLWRRLPSPEEQREVVRSIQSEADDAAAAQDQAGYSLSSAEAVLQRSASLVYALPPTRLSQAQRSSAESSNRLHYAWTTLLER
jgi:ABC-type Na+ efflux pump permease subunit